MLPNKKSRRIDGWQLKTKKLTFDDRQTKVMGIVNVTPDSFSDGGQFREHKRAVEHALKLVEQGADVIDVGGESTRPYSEPVSTSEELDRVVRVVEETARQTQIPVSIDTSKAAVAKSAIDAGAEIINDVTGLDGDPEMLQVAHSTGAGLCVMHMQGTPQTMQDHPTYENVVSEIFDYLQIRLSTLLQVGIERSKICLDPGIGFGKTHEHNFELIRSSSEFLKLPQPILIGHSRKGFIGQAIGNKKADRDFGTLAISLFLARSGIHLLRVHNVQATRHALDVQAMIIS